MLAVPSLARHTVAGACPGQGGPACVCRVATSARKLHRTPPGPHPAHRPQRPRRPPAMDQPGPLPASQEAAQPSAAAAAGSSSAGAAGGDDPYAFTPAGVPRDPVAFHKALLADAEKVAALRRELPPPEADVLLAPPGQLDVAAFSALLARAYAAEKARVERFRGPSAWAERSVDALRASAPVPRDTVQVYEQLRRAGLQYGPAFRLLRNIHVPLPPAASGASASASSA